ncbi:MAG: hypothetical protein LBP95_07250 [Deltaproteobacteria bacterium]|jgi:ATP:corrinoid adenosyltransferase|nr:hypothetical protein [Deltaproteobacteria bacterium]
MEEKKQTKAAKLLESINNFLENNNNILISDDEVNQLFEKSLIEWSDIYSFLKDK